MAAVGVLIIVLFSALAIAAPVLTSHDPRFDVVAGAFSPPTWAHYFPGYQDKSENIAFQGLNVQPSSVSTSKVSDYDTTVTLGGSSGPQTVVVSKTMDYAYDGPPARFQANVVLIAHGVSAANAANFTVYYQRTDDVRHWVIWKGNLTVSDRPVTPVYRLDSAEGQLVKFMNISSSTYNPAQVIFDRRASYVYSVAVTFQPSTTSVGVTVTDFSTQLLGTSYGLLGTDDQGRDLWAAFIYGARVSLLVGLAASFLGIVIGLVVGLVAGFIGGFVDEVLMRFNDMILVIPTLPLIIVLLAILSPNINNIILIIGLLGWNGFARIVRSQVLSLRERPFIEAARAAGAGTTHILTRHVVPNIISLIYVSLALSVPAAILTEAGLSFLGLYDPTATSWGRTVNESLRGGTALGSLWWWVLPPGFAIAILSLSFILVGYGLDEIFNPKLRRRR
jgi:peptide/nickel transport system permease protein